MECHGWVQSMFPGGPRTWRRSLRQCTSSFRSSDLYNLRWPAPQRTTEVTTESKNLRRDFKETFLIPLEWSRIESGSLSPWKHVWILFYAYFFFSGWAPEIKKKYSKTMFDHFCCVNGPGTSTIWCFWVLIPSDFILNHLNHDSGFCSGSLWQCFLLAFLRILADKRIKRCTGKENQEIKRTVPQQTWVWSLTSSGFFNLHHLYRKIGKCGLLRFLLWLLCLYLMWSPFLLLMSPMSLLCSWVVLVLEMSDVMAWRQI